jgi:hypothetical protein
MDRLYCRPVVGYWSIGSLLAGLALGIFATLKYLGLL